MPDSVKAALMDAQSGLPRENGVPKLALKITDKAANKTLTRDVNFTVKAS